MFIDPDKITWSQITDVDLATRRSQVEMVPDNYKGLFSFTGWYELRATGDNECAQHFEGDLVIHLPIVGPLAERAIAGSIRENIAATAHLIERYVASQELACRGLSRRGQPGRCPRLKR